MCSSDLLLIEVDGNNKEVLYAECETINKVLEKFECDEILFAEDTTQKEIGRASCRERV